MTEYEPLALGHFSLSLCWIGITFHGATKQTSMPVQELINSPNTLI